MPFYRRLALTGRPDEALNAARSILATHGFRVERRGDVVYAEGPSLNSTKENPLRGAGRVRVQVEDGELRVAADLAGTKTLSIFVVAFPAAMALGFVPLFGLKGALPLAPWLVVGPGMVWWIRGRTVGALEAFAATLAAWG